MGSVAVLWGATIASAVSTTATTISAVATLASLWGTAVILFLVDPAGFGEAVVEGDPEGLKWHLAFAVAFGTGDVSTTEAAGATETDTFGTEIHGGLQRALHGAAEADPALKLDGDLLGDELGIQLRLADLDDVDLLTWAPFARLVMSRVMISISLPWRPMMRPGREVWRVTRTLFQARSMTTRARPAFWSLFFR
jgi:hypothetical protein